jgi:hypothetical protein
MPGVEKSLHKAAAASELEEELERALTNERNELTAITGGVSVLEVMIARVGGLHKKVEKDLEKGEISEDECIASRKYLGLAVNTLVGGMRDMKDNTVAVKHRSEGLQKALNIVSKYGVMQERFAEVAQEQDEDEDAYRQERANEQAIEDEVDLEDVLEIAPKKQGNGNEPAAPPEKEEESVEPEVACDHCGLPMELASGSTQCVPCVSYKNRYKKLPPEKVLTARRKRYEESLGRNT